VKGGGDEEEGLPFWVYIIIGVGALLLIAAIVGIVLWKTVFNRDRASLFDYG